jgi:hypothetical protein
MTSIDATIADTAKTGKGFHPKLMHNHSITITTVEPPKNTSSITLGKHMILRVST